MASVSPAHAQADSGSQGHGARGVLLLRHAVACAIFLVLNLSLSLSLTEFISYSSFRKVKQELQSPPLLLVRGRKVCHPKIGLLGCRF